MYSVSLWRNGCQKTIALEFDTLEDARWYANQPCSFHVDEAHIYCDEDEDFIEIVEL